MSPMETFESACPENLAGRVAELLPPSARLITVDGHSGVGKSRLAHALAELSGATLLKVDNFLDRGRAGKYVAKVKREALISSVNGALSLSRVVVDGICLEHLLRSFEGTARFRVYVQAVASAHASWSDEAHRRAQLGTELYHRRYKPEQHADLLVLVPHADLTDQREAVFASTDY